MPDPDLVRDALAQQDEVNKYPELWESTYGFAHQCKCGEHYAQGQMIEITVCNAGMTADALDTCATQQKALKAIAAGVESPELYAAEFTR
jgi:hypothetical protein